MPKSHEQHLTEQVHELKRSLKEEVFYPEHAPRTETPEYKKIHHELVVVQDKSCLVCGVRNSTLHDQTKNKYGAKALETHHHVLEWALANAVDLNKFNERIVGRHKELYPNDSTYDHDFTEEEMKAWIDHHPHNLWVLCDIHHRHNYVGIHAISGPIWGAQDLIKDDFVLTPFNEEIKTEEK